MSCIVLDHNIYAVMRNTILKRLNDDCISSHQIEHVLPERIMEERARFGQSRHETVSNWLIKLFQLNNQAYATRYRETHMHEITEEGTNDYEISPFFWATIGDKKQVSNIQLFKYFECLYYQCVDAVDSFAGFNQTQAKELLKELETFIAKLSAYTLKHDSAAYEKAEWCNL